MAEHKHTKRARAVLNRAGYSVGGHLSAKEDEAKDKRMIGRAIAEHEAHDHPGKPKTKLRLRDGGCAMGGEPSSRGDRKPRGHKNAKGHKTVVNVVVGHGAPQKQAVPVPVPVPGGPGPGAGPMPPDAGPVPGPGMPPGPMGQKHGGRSYKKGGKVKRSSGGDLNAHDAVKGLPAGQFKKGGKVPVPMDSGAGGGKGRLEKIKDYGKKG